MQIPTQCKTHIVRNTKLSHPQNFRKVEVNSRAQMTLFYRKITLLEVLPTELLKPVFVFSWYKEKYGRYFV